MLEQMKLALYWAREFNDEGLHIILMLIALVYIAWKTEEKVHRRLLLGYTILFAVLYFCPPVVWFITKMIGDNVYWRMCWLLPLPIIIAYGMVKLWAATGSKWKKTAELVIFVVLLGVMGQVLYVENSPYEPRCNWGKIPGSPAAICNIINANRGSEDEWVMVAAPEDMVPYIIQYDPSFQQIYGRKGNSRSGYIMRALDDEELNYKKLCRKLREKKCNYIVLPDGEGRIDAMQSYGFSMIGMVGTYVIYKDMEWTP